MKQNSKEPMVSAVITTYNRADYLRKSLHSALSQSYENLEVIVVDDASTDGTHALLTDLERQEPRLRVIRRTVNSGLPAVARNEGSRAARGEYLAFLDSDDYWLPNKLDKQVAFMEGNPVCGLCHTYCQIEEPDGRHLYIRREKDMPQSGDLYRDMLRGNFITTSSVMVRKHLFDAVGGFHESPDFQIGEDKLFFLNIMRLGPVGFLPEVLAVYRKHPNNICHSSDQVKKDMAGLFFYERFMEIPDYFRDRDDRKLVEDGYVRICSAASYRARKRGDFPVACRMARAGMRARPYSRRLLKQFILAKLCIQ